MRSLVIKAKNKYENKRAKREDGGGKGVRILGRLEVIETHKRGIIAMLWIGIFWNIKETHHSLPRQTCFLLVLRLLLFLITSRRVDSLIVNSRSPSVCSRRTASSLVSPLPPSLPTSLSIRHPTPFFTLSSMQQLLLHPRPSVTRSVRACISSTWLLLERELVRPIALHPTWQTDSFRLSISYQFNRHHLLVVVRSSPFIFLLFWGGGDNNNWAPPFPFDGYSRL